MAEMSASDFITKWLAVELNVRWLLVGEDFRFGRQRTGDVKLLKELGQLYGIEVHTLGDITDEQGHRISSSEVRGALAAGDVRRAANLLGRPFGMTGHIVHGKKLGRTLNMPTMNMRVTPRCAARSGIYVVRAHGLGPTALPGVASLGVRPTVEDDGRILLETHLFDLNVDAYGKLVRVELLQHLRDEEKFPDLPTLTAAMHADAQHARAYFALHGL
jgi:riboflavin kinase/FMN adenylyltransferase